MSNGDKPDISDLTRVLASETNSTRRKRKQLLDKLEEYEELKKEDYAEITRRLINKSIESEELERDTYDVLDEYFDSMNHVHIDIEINESKEVTEDSRRGFLEKLFWGGAAVTGAGLLYEGATSSGSDIRIADENVGEAPANYSIDVIDDDEVRSYIDSMSNTEPYSNIFAEVENDIGTDEADMGFMHDQNRIDFYDEEIITSVEMSDNLYDQAVSEFNQI